ncbi:MAG: large conductance mechanosensitive channel protein MscL [Verrucomicrobiota bacterium]
MSMLKEYREFVLKGNMLDVAIGVVIGAVSAMVASSLVNNVVMPPVSLLMGGLNLSELAWTLKAGDAAAGVEPIAINYGLFINDLLALLIIAFAAFIFVKLYNRARKMAPPTEELKLLEEIRAALKK